MNLSSSSFTRMRRHALALATIAAVCSAPAMAQNKKRSWEVFIYFGGFVANDIPSAKQSGEITTYRTDPSLAFDPTNLSTVFVPNFGFVGGTPLTPDPNNPSVLVFDPNYAFDTLPSGQFNQPPCNGFFTAPPTDPNDPRFAYYDECDADQEARWRYNASGIKTNGAIQKDSSEFQLGLRGGYNFTRHWELEFDLGFGKQRVDLTQNLVPLLRASINDISDPRAAQLAAFYQSTWATSDYASMVLPSNAASPGEHPNVISSRIVSDSRYDIPVYFPILGPNLDPNFRKPQGETFPDVTGWVNRVFQDPTAFRNRGNQINIDTFTVSLSGVYNFNTKADSRIVPYVGAGVGRWMRSYDSPYSGNDTDFMLGQVGIRFFVNEIFSFRADGRYVKYMDNTFTIKGKIKNFNLEDREFNNFGVQTCVRDQRVPAPPCTTAGTPPPANWAFPDLAGGGGNASVSVEGALDDFYEFRLGFDVVLGGK